MFSHSIQSNCHTMPHTINHSASRSLGAPYRTAYCRLGWKIRLAAIAAALSLAAIRPAAADSFGYSVNISSSLALMEAPTNPSAQLQVSEQSGLVDRMASNDPIIDITNTSTGDTISNLQLTLNDPESVIEALKVLSSNGTATGAFATNEYGGPATSIDISFATPLAPGQSVMWAMELAPVNGYSNIGWTPGYQNILFPTNNPIPGTNASVTVTYNDGSGDPTVTNALPNLAAFDDALTVDPTTTCSSSGDPTSLYTLTVGGTPTPTPEPGTLVLLALGCLPLGWRVWRKRQSVVV